MEVVPDASDRYLQWWRSELKGAEANPRMLADSFNLKANFNKLFVILNEKC